MMNYLTLAHLRWFRCIVIFFSLINASESSISASDFAYCYGEDYTETIGNSFIACAVKWVTVAITACDSEYQSELEFAIANDLYDTCTQPQCVYYSLELAFRWNSSLYCYSAKSNTGDEDECWESEYNYFYTSGHLVSVLGLFCFATAAPTEIPTTYPSAYPTQWCDGKEYNDTIGTGFISCGSTMVPGLTLETCDQDYQDALYFGIANELFERCERPDCVWANFDYAFYWDDDTECYEVQYMDTSGDCWSGRLGFFWSNGYLATKLASICFDTAAPTLTPTAAPSTLPTEDPTRSPTNTPTSFPSPSPTTFPSPSPTTFPSPYPTEAPTRNPTRYPTVAPTMNPTQTPTNLPSVTPTQTPTTAPSNTPTTTPSEAPTTSPTEDPTSSPTMPWVERTSDASSFFVSAEVSCITKYQIADTIAPLGRVVNVTGQEIGIDSYFNVSMNMTGLEVDGFWVRWLVVLPDRNEELVELIQAGDITDEFTVEFETEFNCSMIVENLRVWSLMDAQTIGRRTDDLLLPLICGMIIFVLYVLFVIFCFTRKSGTDSGTPDGFPYEEHQDASSGSGQVGTTAGTTRGGADFKRSKSVSFTSVVIPAGEEPASTNGDKTEGSNDKETAKRRGILI